MQVMVVGLGDFGLQLALELKARDIKVIGVEKDTVTFQNAQLHIEDVIEIDATQILSLGNIEISSFDHCFVCIGSMGVNLAVNFILNNAGAKSLHSRISSDIHKQFLESIGVKSLIFPEKDFAQEFVQNVLNPFKRIPVQSAFNFFAFQVPASWVNKNLKELDLEFHFGLMPVWIQKKFIQLDEISGEEKIISEMEDFPNLEYRFGELDHAGIFGKATNIDVFVNYYLKDNL